MRHPHRRPLAVLLPSPTCKLYGVRGAGNLSVCGLFGKQKHIRLLYGSAPEKALSVLQHLAEGNGIRRTERLTGVHRDTVMRLARLAGQHAHDELAAFSPQDP